MAIAKKRKKFFEVEMPIINKQTQIQAFDINELEGKYIKYDLTRILRGKNVILQLKVNVKDGKATSTPKEIVLVQGYLSRVMRKGTDYIEDSFSANCNNAQLRIKPFLIARRKVSKKIRCAIREKAREELINYFKSKDALQIFEDVLKNKLQKELSLKLKKIYPLALCEIRILKIEKDLEKSAETKSKKDIKEKTKEKIEDNQAKDNLKEDEE